LSINNYCNKNYERRPRQHLARDPTTDEANASGRREVGAGTFHSFVQRFVQSILFVTSPIAFPRFRRWWRRCVLWRWNQRF